jgi:hypothetical protein
MTTQIRFSSVIINPNTVFRNNEYKLKPWMREICKTHDCLLAQRGRAARLFKDYPIRFFFFFIIVYTQWKYIYNY